MVVYKEESYKIVGAAFKVYNTLGPGFLEAVYQEALEIALTDVGIPFESQREIYPEFHGRKMAHSYRPDLICHGKIVVEQSCERFAA